MSEDWDHPRPPKPSIDTAGPPFPATVDPAIDPDPRFSFATLQGMSLRDWFAGMAMQGYLMGGIPTTATYGDVAEKAYRAADAMIKERKQ